MFFNKYTSKTLDLHLKKWYYIDVAEACTQAFGCGGRYPAATTHPADAKSRYGLSVLSESIRCRPIEYM